MDDADLPRGGHPDLRLEAVLDSISDGLALMDNAWRFTYVNAAAIRMAGRPATAFLGRTAFDTLNIDPSNPFHLAYTAAKSSGEPVAFTAWSDIFATWLEVRGYPHAGGFTILFRDVAEMRRAHLMTLEGRRSLDTARAINQRIVETSQDLILVTDREGVFVQVSPSALAILGHAREAMIGRSGAEFIHPDDLDGVRAEMRAARRTLGMRSFDCRYRHKDGRIVVLAWTGIWSPAERQHFFIGRDMTDRLAQEERLRRAQRLEAVGQLTGGLAHDFNNLLTVMIGNLDLLHGRLGGDRIAGELTDLALAAALRGAELTRQLLAFARRQPLAPAALDVNGRIAATLDLLTRTLGETIEVLTTLEDDLWPAFADPAQLESALVNLAINARDAMPGGGRLTIETANRELDGIYAEQNLDVAPGAYVMLAVSDTGTGMTPDVMTRAFEPFFTTKPPGQGPGHGSGLGLSMVYGFVRQSQGHVKIYSEPGRGTTVRLYLPRADRPAAQPAPSAPALPVARPGERVLVVEDNADVRRIVVQQLRGLGYGVLEAADGPEALALIDGGAAFDLLFTDVVMPGGIAGDALARLARERRPGLRVLLTSGFAGGSIAAGRPGDAFRHLLNKPYRQSDLAARVRAALDDPG